MQASQPNQYQRDQNQHKRLHPGVSVDHVQPRSASQEDGNMIDSK